ncbi:GGDEF domain-containing protein [Simiduia sp. 21SJ11W-1]|uniref:GGDEF domain-containing protein n=1 Tax=Simiduia sp. 21SJ11W-1 TaxID=2909669 RepID=UPI00209FD54F|nr:GGDEF domain-containing protein [Simiduia sp. 21SJ11W-1]UTA46430.1 GGDEF domain-containing protein [Simiduia sp. 21SJ11W-1]
MQESNQVTPLRNGTANKRKLTRIAIQEEPDLRHKLVHALQTTLDVQSLLDIFIKYLNRQLPIGGLSYRHPSRGIHLSLGQDNRHHCDYRLITPRDNLGEIRFNRAKRFSEAEMARIESLLGTLIYPLRNCLQYQDALKAALHDALTGTGNRVAMDNAMRRELQLANRNEQPLALMMLDLDHFKQINDTYGHAVGDEVLHEVAQTVMQVARATDMTFRYGGEEFAVVLNNTDLRGAEIIAERVRTAISELEIQQGNHTLQVTASIGICQWKPEMHVKTFFEQADKALYLAKQQGRNRVVSQSPESAAVGA